MSYYNSLKLAMGKAFHIQLKHLAKKSLLLSYVIFILRTIDY